LPSSSSTFGKLPGLYRLEPDSGQLFVGDSHRDPLQQRLRADLQRAPGHCLRGIFTLGGHHDGVDGRRELLDDVERHGDALALAQVPHLLALRGSLPAEVQVDGVERRHRLVQGRRDVDDQRDVLVDGRVHRPVRPPGAGPVGLVEDDLGVGVDEQLYGDLQPAVLERLAGLQV
jgi:hypothetical protein